MTKSELIQKLMTRYPHLYAHDCDRIVNVVFDSITDALVSGERAELRGFGAFFAKDRAPRKGRNPRTGESVDVPGKRVPFFRTGKALHQQLNPGSVVQDQQVETIGQINRGAPS